MSDLTPVLPPRQAPQFADAEQGLQHVFVRDLVLDAQIGVYDGEAGRSQPIRINLDLAVAELAKSPKAYADVVCYDQLVQKVKALVGRGHIGLQENLAEQIAAICLLDDRVRKARVRVEKLAAIPEADSAGVEIERLAKTSPRG